MAERIHSTERIETQIGNVRAIINVTRIWDPEAAARIRQSMVHMMVAQIEERLAREDADSAAD